MRLHWGVGIAATYLVFAGATAGFVAFAMQQRVDLVRPDYYAHSLTLDAQRRAEARTAALGSRFHIDVDARGRTIAVTWPPEHAGRAPRHRVAVSAVRFVGGPPPRDRAGCAGTTVVPAGRPDRPLAGAAGLDRRRRRLPRRAGPGGPVIAFAAGLLLGVSGSVHCAAMCGPLVAVADGAAARQGGSSRWRGRAMYHGGRMGVYALLGAAAGASGAAIEGRGFGRGLAVAAGLALMVQACVAAGAARGVAYSGPGTAASHRLAGAVSRAAGWLRRHGLARPSVMGALNGLLPCGLVYAALIAASGIGGVSAALSLMIGFGLGTLPALLGVGMVSARRRRSRRPRRAPRRRRGGARCRRGGPDRARPRARDARTCRHGGAWRRSARAGCRVRTRASLTGASRAHGAAARDAIPSVERFTPRIRAARDLLPRLVASASADQPRFDAAQVLVERHAGGRCRVHVVGHRRRCDGGRRHDPDRDVRRARREGARRNRGQRDRGRRVDGRREQQAGAEAPEAHVAADAALGNPLAGVLQLAHVARPVVGAGASP